MKISHTHIKALLAFSLLGFASFANAATLWNGTSASAFAGGVGSKADPYQIATAEQLAKLAADVSAGNSYRGYYFKLTDDILLNNNVLKNDTVNTGSFTSWPGIGDFVSNVDYKAFSGTFDGNGHSVLGLYINNYNQTVGFFRVTDGAVVKNLYIKDAYVYGSANVGGVVGYSFDSRFINCANAGYINGSGSYHAGIVGVATGSTSVANCYNTGRIAGKNNTAGLVGRNGAGDGFTCVATNGYNTGKIEATKTNIAGLVAENNSGCSVTNAYYLSSCANGVYTNTGTVDNLTALPASEFNSSAIVETLNTNSLSIPGACRWKLSGGYPVFDFSESTADTDAGFDAFNMASNPSPETGDTRADADNGSITLSWTPATASNLSKQYIYISTDSSALASAAAGSSTCLAGTVGGSIQSYIYSGDLYCMNTYYWRIDSETSDGTITAGEIWSFKPRHLAFYGADGYGKYATGGRGGKVVYVTNLNDSGAGSLREAVTNEIGPRTILFAVSGVIKLESRLTCASPNVTVAAQSAPGRGICVAAAPFGVGTDNIFRFVRVRVGSGTTYDGMGMAANVNSITDHCSISWTIDEAFSSRNAKDITLQRTLISEALNIAGHKNYPEGTGHGYAATIGGNIGSFHHNLLAHNQGRNWSMGGGLDGNNEYAGRLDIFNNVVYNWWHRVCDGGAHEVNFVGNYYKRGAASEESNMEYVLSADLEGTGLGSQSYYFHNNVMTHSNGNYIFDGSDDTQGRRYTLSNGQVLNWEVWQSKPFFESRATIHTARNAYKDVLSDVGATMPCLDNHDVRMIEETLNGTYSCTGAKSQVGGMIDANSESKEGDYSYYTSETRPADFDTDLDGLPNWWEKYIGTNPNSASGDFSDSNADPDHDGYTNLEDYLEWMATPHQEATLNTVVTFSLTDYFMGYSKTTPSYSVANAPAGVTATISNGKLNVVVTKAGLYYISVKVTDAEGDAMTRRLGVFAANNLPETYIYNCESTDVWTTTNNWTPVSVPSKADTTIIRSGEVKAANLSQTAPVYVEADGTFRLTANDTVANLVLQGGTLKSYTSNPLFVLTADSVVAEKASSVQVGSQAASVFSLTGVLVGSEDLTKSGVGSLQLNADASNYSGRWQITEGNVSATSVNALGQNGADVLNGASLTVATANATKSVSVADGGALQLDANLTVESATLGDNDLNCGTYTATDYPAFLSGSGALVVTECASEVNLVANDGWCQLSPNPVASEAMLQLTSEASSSAVISAYNLLGVEVYSSVFNLNGGENNITLDFSSLPSGVYMLHIGTSSRLQIIKVVKN